jgi:hypothetical protein
MSTAWIAELVRTKAPVRADSDVDKPEDGTLWILEIAGHV